MTIKYYEAVERSDSFAFQEWEEPQYAEHEGFTFEQFDDYAGSVVSIYDDVQVIQEEGIKLWHDNRAPLIAIVTTGDIEDYRDLWGPLAFPK